MARYKTDEGVVLNTALASQSWSEKGVYDGRGNRVSCATREQFYHEALYRSSKGTYWIEQWSDWQGSQPSARVLTPCEVVTWLLLNGYEVPDDLAEIARDLEE